jgi:putative glutamine amidotransferase
MAKLATWIREKDQKWFCSFFMRHPEVEVHDARTQNVDVGQMDGLLLTGGSDIAPEFLRQGNVDPKLIEDVDPERDGWEFEVISEILACGLPILAICRGIQVLNVALGGTLKLDIPGHGLPEQKDNDIQSLSYARAVAHQFERVNSSHHQAIDQLGEGLDVEAWCVADDIIEQVRLRHHRFVVGVQYHPERGKIYDSLFDDFFSQLSDPTNPRGD